MVIEKAVSVVDTAAATEIFYPESDGMPLPDGEYQLRHFMDLIAILKHFFRNRLDAWASGNTFMYYEEGNPRVSVSPDCYVVFGVDTDLILNNNNYRIWDMGKAPDFVLEIGSPNTWRQDLGPKRNLYARLGIGEYWKFDPSGGDHYGEPLVGERLVDGEYRRMEMNIDPDGGAWGYSPTLNLELHWVDGRLRLYDPEGGRWLQNMEETAEEVERERTARESAEARLAEMEAELRRLRAE
jgi:Uma2 family endonuclease